MKRRPDAVFLPVDRPVYEAASAEVMATLRTVPGATIQVLGWDEAFVGVETDDHDVLVAEFGPTIGPHYGRLGRGGGYATWPPGWSRTSGVRTGPAPGCT